MTRHTATSSRHAARFLAAGLMAAAFAAGPVWADDKPDPVVAKIGTGTIHLSDVVAAASTLPAQARQLPPEQLMPRLLDQMVDTRVLAAEARKNGLDKDPAVQRVLREVEERALVSAMLEREVGPHVTDTAVKERFDKEVGSAPPVMEIHARHILVDDEATGKKVIAELKKGGDFAALSKQYSKDAAAVEQGGDLGYFKATDMVPEFSTAAFALKDKEISPVPIHTQFGWHVVQTLDHRAAPPPSYDQ
jgi:peptidyl-prolyl cis-trans isomerase C